MNYKELQAELKVYRDNGFTLEVKLNAKKAELEAELERLNEIEIERESDECDYPEIEAVGYDFFQTEPRDSFTALVTHTTYTAKLLFVELPRAILAFVQAFLIEQYLKSTYDLRLLLWIIQHSQIYYYLEKDLESFERQVRWLWANKVPILDRVFGLA
jgi:hypothetical protein